MAELMMNELMRRIEQPIILSATGAPNIWVDRSSGEVKVFQAIKDNQESAAMLAYDSEKAILYIPEEGESELSPNTIRYEYHYATETLLRDQKPVYNQPKEKMLKMINRFETRYDRCKHYTTVPAEQRR